MIQSFRIQLKKIANIWRIKLDGMSATKSEAAQIHFLSNVFVAVAVRQNLCVVHREKNKSNLSFLQIPFLVIKIYLWRKRKT